MRYYDSLGIDTSSLGVGDVLVTNSNGFSQLATVAEVVTEQATTAGTARTVRYRISAPGGTWDADDSTSYAIHLQAGEVQDTSGSQLPAANLGSFLVNITDTGQLDVAAILANGEATVTATPWDIGNPLNIFDGSLAGLYRSQNINPAVVTLEFDTPQQVSGFRTYMNGDTSSWRVEAANSQADLDSQTGSYVELVPTTITPSDVYSTIMLPADMTATHFRLTVERLAGDDYVHINAWDFLADANADLEVPSATLQAGLDVVGGDKTQSFVVSYADDQAIDMTTINYGDVLVAGPNGYSMTAALFGLDLNANGPARDVTYFIAVARR